MFFTRQNQNNDTDTSEKFAHIYLENSSKKILFLIGKCGLVFPSKLAKKNDCGSYIDRENRDFPKTQHPRLWHIQILSFLHLYQWKSRVCIGSFLKEIVCAISTRGNGEEKLKISIKKWTWKIYFENRRSHSKRSMVQRWNVHICVRFGGPAGNSQLLWFEKKTVKRWDLMQYLHLNLNSCGKNEK